MKFTIAPASKPILAALRAALHDGLAGYRQAETSLAKMRADLPVYTATVAELEAKTAYDDETGVASIQAKQGQLRLLESKIPLAENTLATLPDQLFETFSQLKPAIAAAVRPSLDALTQEITADLKPHYGKDHSLERAVGQSPKLVSFQNFFHRSWAWDAASSISLASQALALLDDLLAGKNPWKFEAQ